MNRSDRGSITPLLIGFALIVTGLVSVVVDASAGYLQREGLNSVADSAALAATDGIQNRNAYTSGLAEDLAVDVVEARRFVARYLEESGATRRYEDLIWTVELQRQAVVVRLRATLDLPIPLPGMGTKTSVTGSSSAVVRIENLS